MAQVFKATVVGLNQTVYGTSRVIAFTSSPTLTVFPVTSTSNAAMYAAGARSCVIVPAAPGATNIGNSYYCSDTQDALVTLMNALSTTTTTLIQTHTPVSINATATATAAQVASGYIKSTSAAATTITLPTGTLLGAEIGAIQGTTFDLYIDNTAGANTVTIAVATNGILSAAAAANGASQGLLTVPSGATGLACFRIMFSSATAYAFTRIA